MGYVLGERSRKNLEGVEPRLVKVVERAIALTEQDFLVTEGVRTREGMWAAWGKGRTVAQCAACGVPAKYALPAERQVTWLKDPLKSNHRKMPSGFGHAVDLVPYPVDWKAPGKFDAIAKAMFAAADELNVKIRWGADWDKDGKAREKGEDDSPHFELTP